MKFKNSIGLALALLITVSNMNIAFAEASDSSTIISEASENDNNKTDDESVGNDDNNPEDESIGNNDNNIEDESVGNNDNNIGDESAENNNQTNAETDEYDNDDKNISLLAASYDVYVYDYIYNNDRGEYIWTGMHSGTVAEGGNVTLTAPTKQGYVFKGWFTDMALTKQFDTDTPITSDMITEGKLKLYIKWMKEMPVINKKFPTIDEIKEEYKKLNLSPFESNIFAENPSISTPYAAGKLTDDFVESGLDYMNFIRNICGLQTVEIFPSDQTCTIDGVTSAPTMIDMTQHGAVLLKAGGYDHHPAQPSDMADDFYNIGHKATASSNIAYASGANYNNLAPFVQGWVDDSGKNNMGVLGHRRWVINPTMKYTAFGYVKDNNVEYSNHYSFDKSNNEADEYDYISYPAGNFPSNIIDNKVPWSVSLNPELYTVKSLSDVRVKITKKSNGKEWTISENDTPASLTEGCTYLKYDTESYGINRCLIFGIGQDKINNDELNGEFEVEISGLEDANGAAVIKYTVNFFDVNAETPEPSFIYGDVNIDEKVDKADALAIINKILHKTPLAIEDETDEYMTYADVDGDTTLTSTDAALIIKKSLNPNFTLPVEKD